jgi:hypothetical protein
MDKTMAMQVVGLRDQMTSARPVVAQSATIE